MKLSVIAAFAAVLCLGYFVRAQDSGSMDQASDVKMSGVLIDQKCGAKMAEKEDPQKAAEEHSKSCCLECGPEHGYAIMSDGKLTKIDNESKDKVTDYLKKDDSTTNVTVEGTKDANGEIKVSSIAASEKKMDEKQETQDQD